MIKKLIPYLLFLGILTSNKIYSQYKNDELWIRIPNLTITQSVAPSVTTNNAQLNQALSTYQAQRIEKVFPYSKLDQLKKLYKIKFLGNKANFMTALQQIPTMENVIQRPVESQIAMYVPSDYFWTLPTINDPNGWLWHLKKINAEQAWDITRGASTTVIAVLDTWFDINHVDLAGKINPTYDPYDNTPYNTDCTQNNHGTTVASFIAAKSDDGPGLASMGFHCSMIAYQAWAGDYIQRAQHASLVMGAKVITSSAGGWSCQAAEDPDEKAALKEILDNGTVVVMPAGNGNSVHCEYTSGGVHHAFKPLSPDYDERVILVSSTGKDDKHDSGTLTHSHYPEVDVCAPGYGVMGATCSAGSTFPYYGSWGGTSFSTPIVAGLCGLMKTINPCMSAAQAQKIIKSTTDPIVDAANFPGTVGTGRINAYKAVMAAFSPISIPVLNSGGTIAYSEGSNMNITGALTNRFYLSSTYITCTGTIASGVTVAQKASTMINLNAGFSVALGGTYNGFIKTTDCSYNQGAYRTTETDEKSDVITDMTNGIQEDVAPISYYPNPFNDELNMDITLKEAGNLSVAVYDIYGKLIETVTSGYHAAGKQAIAFRNNSISAGIYIVKIDIGDKHFTQKVFKAAN